MRDWNLGHMDYMGGLHKNRPHVTHPCNPCDPLQLHVTFATSMSGLSLGRRVTMKSHSMKDH